MSTFTLDSLLVPDRLFSRSLYLFYGTLDARCYPLGTRADNCSDKLKSFVSAFPSQGMLLVFIIALGYGTCRKTSAWCLSKAARGRIAGRRLHGNRAEGCVHLSKLHGQNNLIDIWYTREGRLKSNWIGYLDHVY